MQTPDLRAFLLPKFNKGFFIRAALVAALAFILFKFFLIPFRIQGHSMAPTYSDGGMNFCNTLRYTFSPPERYDIVIIRLAGRSVMLLKRVVAVAGETVAFKNGELYINGRKTEEPYITYADDWTLPPRTVKPDHYYVVGDNRRVSMQTHHFGQTPANRIIGAPLW